MRYEIQIEGGPGEAVLREAFPGFEPHRPAEAPDQPDQPDQPAQTLLRGCVADESQLYGLLVRLQELGLHVAGFRRLP